MYLRASKDLDEPTHARSLLYSPAFLTVFTLYVMGVFNCICLIFLFKPNNTRKIK